MDPRPPTSRAVGRLAVAALLASACAGTTSPGAGPSPPHPRVASASALPKTNAAVGRCKPAPDRPKLVITIAPRPTPQPHVHVRIEAEAAPAALTHWVLADASAVRTDGIKVSDAGGTLPADTSLAGGELSVRLTRSPCGRVRVDYDVASVGDPSMRPLAMEVGTDQLRAAGESLLLLPAALDEAPASVSLNIDGESIYASATASSFGVGAVKDRLLRGRALRHASFLAGQLGTAVFRGLEGDDDAAWIGYTAFDPRSAAAEVAMLRSAFKAFFGDRQPSPFALLIVSDPRAKGAVSSTPRSQSVLLHAGVEQTWNARVRLAVAQRLVQQWIGGQLWIGPVDAAHEGESYWFTQGVARHFAAMLALRTQVLDPDDYRDEIVGQLSTAYGSPYRGSSNVELARQAKRPGAVALLTARGALYAARVSQLMREASRGKRSLDPVVLELLERARREGGVLPTTVWIEAMRRELGAAEAAAFERLIGAGAEPTLPRAALGPCYAPVPARYPVFDQGFDLEKTLASESRRVVGLRRDGPAHRAGLREGDVVRDARLDPDRPDASAELSVERAGSSLTLRYLPSGTRTGQGWKRKPGMSDAQCRD